MRKLIRVLAMIIVALLILVALAALLLNIAGVVFYSEFYSTSVTKTNIPGLLEGFVPQGLDYVDGGFIVAGYMTDDSASRLYYVKEDGTAPVRTVLKKANGKDFTGHCGGVAHYGDYFYVGGSGGLSVFSLSDIMDGDGEATQIGRFEAGMTASWVYVYKDYIYIGRFIDGGQYEASDWQSNVTPAGDENPSVMARFRLNGDADTYGIASTPECAYSITHWVQGGALCDDGIILSTSSGINTSKFYFYTWDTERVTSIEYGDEDWGGSVTIPLYHLDTENLTYTLKAPPMAEEIEIVDGRVYISNESACMKYFFGWLVGGQSFYSFELKDEYFGK